MDKRLKLNYRQELAWRNLKDAIEQCEEENVKFAYDDSTSILYAWNGEHVEDRFYCESAPKGSEFVGLGDLAKTDLETLDLEEEDEGFNVKFKA